MLFLGARVEACRVPSTVHGAVCTQVPLLENETYTEYLLRTVDDTDLWLSWWLRTTERMDGMVMLNGHVDASGVLVAPPPKIKQASMLDRMFTLFAPFDPWLWVSILAMIVSSGIVDWVLEHGAGDHGGKMKSSIYEYAAGVLWGGSAGGKWRLPCLRTPPHLHAWWLRGLRPLLCAPERGPSRLDACSGLSSPPQAARS
jgi:hypothetical protein